MSEIARPAWLDGQPNADNTTEMLLRVTEPRKTTAGSGVGALGDYSTLASDLDSYEVPGISSFNYVNDLMAMGDPWRAVVPEHGAVWPL